VEDGCKELLLFRAEEIAGDTMLSMKVVAVVMSIFPFAREEVEEEFDDDEVEFEDDEDDANETVILGPTDTLAFLLASLCSLLDRPDFKGSDATAPLLFSIDAVGPVAGGVLLRPLRVP